MTDSRSWLGNALQGPARDESALVFAVREPQAVRSAAARVRSGAPSAGGLDEVFRYLQERPEARLTTLGGDQPGPGSGNTRGMPPPAHGGEALAEIGYLQLAASGDRERLQEALMRDRSVRYAEAPAIHYVLDPAPAPGPSPEPPRDAYQRQWWLHKCGFPEVWEQLETGAEAKPIGMIDQGSAHGYPDLDGRIEHVDVLPPGSEPSKCAHAASVAGVIAAIRENRAPDRMAGCCSARLNLYNVFDHKGFNPLAYYQALLAVARARLPVCNLSLGSREPDRTAEELLRRCHRAGVVLVAAAGDFAAEGSPPTYPSAYREVIAVGGTDRWDRPTQSSCRGGHVWISAPGQDIFTLYGDEFREKTGTSYSAAMVSAAVWLARRRRPECGAMDVRTLLARSAVGSGTRTNDLGHGRLDMVKLVEALKTMPCGRVYRGGQPARMRSGAS